MAPQVHDDECHYKVLGVGKRASLNEIRKAFKKLALKFHPDKQHTEQDMMDATAVFVKINNAHEVLSDPVQRAQYDKKLKASRYKRTTKNSAGSGESSGNRQQQNQHEWGSYQGDRSGNSSQQKSYSSSKPRSSAWGSTSWGSTNGYSTYHHGYGTYHQDSNRSSSENPQSSNTGGSKSSFYGRRHSYQHASQNNQWSSNRGSHSSHQEGNNAYSSSKPRQQSSTPPNGRSSSGNHQKTSSKPSARSNEQGSQSSKSKSSSHSRSAIFGTCKTTGDPCKRCIHLGRYCYQHKTQDPSCSSYQPPPQPEYPREDSFGRNANGIPCKRCMKQGGFCYQHTYQQEEYNSGGAKQYSKKRSPNTSSGSSRRVYGVRADGKPCTRCMKQGRFCFQHVHQET